MFSFEPVGKVSFSESETDFLTKNEACRLTTCHNGVPHVVPVSYIFENASFFIVTDYETRKYENIKRNKKALL